MHIIKTILAIAFILGGGAKVFKAKPMVDQFKEFGLPKYLVMVIGLLEVLGAVGLYIPTVSTYAIIGLLLLMIGAVTNHLKVKHPVSKIAPALILGLLLVTFLYLSMTVA